MRINKLMSNAGRCSRRETAEWIDAGRIVVNGLPCRQGQWVEWTDAILVDGVPVVSIERTYIAFHKPRGIVCTYDGAVPGNLRAFLGFEEYVFPVGRLDKDSEGLLILTNDGPMTQRVLSPEMGHHKTYQVRVDRALEEDFLHALGTGMDLGGWRTRLAAVEVLGPCRFRITLTEGKNRQIRRMCRAFGYTVQELLRMDFAGVRLDGLAPGAWRRLTGEEVQMLKGSL